ncbi:MAG: hypothetical protein D6732_04655 [Methanobacteriota archaeon]|nr:MAG: hypothetical protein D6732_04655 [Euryarchaeota archaeon]
MKTPFSRICLLVLLSGTLLLAKNENEGKSGLAFLKIGVGARAAGMGEAFVAVSNDAFSAFWNPAALTRSPSSNVVFAYNNWFQDVKARFGAVAFKKQRSALAFHGYSVSVGDIQVRTTPTNDPLETTSANYLALGISYSRTFSSQLKWGVTVKYLFEKIFVHSASGYAVDMGILYQGLLPNLTVGSTFQNLGTMNALQDQKTQLPKIFRLGAAYSLPEISQSVALLFSGDLVKPLEENLRFHLGSELLFQGQLALRLGYVMGYESRHLSLGVGVLKTAIHVNYSFTPIEENLGNSHRFDLYLSL